MKIEKRMEAFVKLGEYVSEFVSHPENENHELFGVMQNASVLNSWFTRENILSALTGITKYLDEEKLKQWTSGYPLSATNSKRLGVIMAGNIPLVGFHDLLCVLISGHTLVARLSSDDQLLPSFICSKLIDFEPEFKSYVNIESGRLPKNIDGVIATGSNNSGRYFEYYFGKYPHIIRKNRNSLAVLTGEETKTEMEALGKDIFSYFGMGCRNVSKIYFPDGYNVDDFYQPMLDFKHVANHHKYGNNYNYNRTVYLMQGANFFDNNFLILKQNLGMASPIGVVYVEYYPQLERLKERLKLDEPNIQCVIASDKNQLHRRQVNFGKAQQPELWDYADGVDTMDFLTGSNW